MKLTIIRNTILVYLIYCFVMADPNPLNYTVTIRFSMVFFLFVSVGITFLVQEMIKGLKK